MNLISALQNCNECANRAKPTICHLTLPHQPQVAIHDIIECRNSLYYLEILPKPIFIDSY